MPDDDSQRPDPLGPGAPLNFDDDRPAPPASRYEEPPPATSRSWEAGRHLNHFGTYAVIAAALTWIGVILLYWSGIGSWWILAVIGIAGVVYGVRGFSAVSRGEATNRSAAIAGGVISLLGAIAAGAYLVVAALAITSIFS